jgi:hypothetical protein
MTKPLSFIRLFVLLLLIIFPFINLFSQTIGNGTIHGNFEADAQQYTPDSAIGAAAVPQKMSMNAFANFLYTSDNFSAGLRYEAYQNELNGYPVGYSGNGILYRFLSFKSEGLEVTVGSFYEQFGSGIILRTYEDFGLGYDNCLDGVRLKYSPIKGLTIKGVIGNQRKEMNYYTGGIVRGIDGELSLNDAIDKWVDYKTKIIIGSSFVSKYESNSGTTSSDTLPANVGAYSGRFNIVNGKFSISGEGAYKINDPDYVNNFINKSGNAALLNAAYSQKGFGLTFAAERIDNMDFRSSRNAGNNDLLINFLPALNKEHTYALSAFYPYATQPNGEFGLQGELFYIFKPSTILGGKYGTNIDINYSRDNNIDKQPLNDSTPVGTSYTDGYKSNALKWSGQLYFQDFNVEITKKVSPTFKFVFTYINLIYDGDVIQKPGFGTVYSQIGVLEMFYKITSKKTIRMELQHLWTNQDQRNWAMVLIEYSISPHWYVAGSDMYNYGTNVTKDFLGTDYSYTSYHLNSNGFEAERLHYLMGSFGYTQSTFRFSLGYGQQRAGIYCVGGVCRTVPASDGLKLTISSSF